MSGISEHRFFRRFGVATIVAVYFLIFVGGIVRSTGSGMGCPDWPRCFGTWVPPTEQGELPENYKDIYSQKRKSKNERIASYLRMLKFNTLADKIAADHSIYTELDFNAVKTWIEYVNRLVGVVIGLLIFMVVVFSFRFIQTDPTLFWLSLSSFFIVGMEGWLGSIVVSTNLLPFAVSVHMGLALFLVGLLIYIVVRAQGSTDGNEIIKNSGLVQWLIILACGLSFLQILAGTQVREEVDLVAASLNYGQRNLWVNKLGNVFAFHRSFSIAVACINASIVYLIKKSSGFEGILNKCATWCVLILVAEIALGVTMAYFAIPAITQPFHLLLGSMLLGIQLWMLFSMTIAKRNKEYTTVVV